MAKVLTFSLIFLLAALACVSRYTQVPTQVAYEIHNPVEYNPPSVYDTWWKQSVACSEFVTGVEVNRELEDIIWIAADSIKSKLRDTRISGLWYRGTIYIDKDLVMVSPLIRHEMLHHIMWPLTHGDELFDFCDPFTPIDQ